MSTVTALRPVQRAAPHLAPAPCLEPAFDEPTLAAAGGGGPAVQGTLALAFTLPSGLAAAPSGGLHLVPPHTPQTPQTQPAPDDPSGWGARFAQSIVEVLAGDRPATQFVSWTSPGVYAQLRRRYDLAASLSTAERIAQRRALARRVHVHRTAEKAAEVTSAIHGQDRVRAMAFRLELTADRWICTALELG